MQIPFMIKISISVLCFVFVVSMSLGQVIPKEYNDLVKKAESLYQAKEYKNSAMTYSLAFKAFGWKAFPDDRYKAACSWTLANNADSAFYQFREIEVYYKIIQHIATDPALKMLHADKRWQPLLNRIEEKKKNIQ